MMDAIAKILEVIAVGGSPVVAALAIILYFWSSTKKEKENAALQDKILEMAQAQTAAEVQMVGALDKVQAALEKVAGVIDKIKDTWSSIAKTEACMGEANRKLDKLDDAIGAHAREVSEKLGQLNNEVSNFSSGRK